MCSHTVSFGTNVFGISCWENIVAVASGHRDIIILDIVTGSQTAILSGHAGEVSSVAFSSDGRLLVSGCGDRTVKLWDVQTGGTIHTFSGHTKLVRCVSISVDGATIASGSPDDTIRLWNVQTGECCCIIESQDEKFLIQFSPTNPQYLMSMSYDGVFQWNISGHQAGPKFNRGYFDFSPDGTQLVLQHRKSVVIHNLSSGAVVTEFQTTEVNHMCCCFSPDGKMVAVSGGSTVCLWNIASTEPCLVETFMGHTNTITALAFSSSSSLISGSRDGFVRFWKISTQSIDPAGIDPKSISLIPVTIMSITLPAEDNTFITSDSGGIVKTWDIFTGVCKASFQTPAKGTNKRDIQIINGRLVLVWHTVQMINIWDIEEEKLLLKIDGPRNLRDIKFSEDGSRVFSIGERVIQAQSIQTGEIVAKAEIKFVNYNIVSFTVNGSRVWVFYTNAKTQVWDFGIPDSSPVLLSDISLHILQPKGAVLWDTGPSCVKEKATGKVVFWLSKRYGRPVNVKWNNQYLFVSFISGEVLVLDFAHVLIL